MLPTDGSLSESAPRLEVRLASPSSDFLAGAAITVDGGYSVEGWAVLQAWREIGPLTPPRKERSIA